MYQNHIFIIMEIHLYHPTGPPNLHNRADQALQAKFNFEVKVNKKRKSESETIMNAKKREKLMLFIFVQGTAKFVKIPGTRRSGSFHLTYLPSGTTATP